MLLFSQKWTKIFNMLIQIFRLIFVVQCIFKRICLRKICVWKTEFGNHTMLLHDHIDELFCITGKKFFKSFQWFLEVKILYRQVFNSDNSEISTRNVYSKPNDSPAFRSLQFRKGFQINSGNLRNIFLRNVFGGF